jgi:mannose-6-phosphate isomerase-like protein (cupin superfamily)
MSMSRIHRSSGAAGERLGPYEIESLIHPDEERAGTVYRVTIEPNQTTAVSYHKVAEEYYFVISGSGVAILDGQPQPLKTGDFLRLPPGCTHAFITYAEPLVMLDVHTPGCRPDRDVYFVGSSPDGFGDPTHRGELS